MKKIWQNAKKTFTIIPNNDTIKLTGNAATLGCSVYSAATDNNISDCCRLSTVFNPSTK